MATTKRSEHPFSITAEQRAEILQILNNEKPPYECRAGRLMRRFGRVLNLSLAAEKVYRDVCGYMGMSKGCEADEVIVSAAHMEQWSGRLKKRAIQNALREITLTGVLPLLEKSEPGGMGKRTTYRFVRNPFDLAAQQAVQATTAKPDDRNVANRQAVVITGDALNALPMPEPRVSAKTQAPVAPERDLVGFDAFYAAYPKQESKGDAEQAWREARIAERELLPAILSAVERQRQQPMWTRDDGRWVPHPAKWLRDKKWEDQDSQANTRVAADSANEADHARTRALLAQRAVLYNERRETV